MKVSTRSRYGLRMMIALALHYEKGLLYLKEIAKNEGISEKYLGQIIIPLRANGLVSSGRGIHGGYVLTRHPSQISVREIVEPLEGGLNLVECVHNPSACKRISFCAAKNVWAKLDRDISETLDGITLQMLVKAPHREKRDPLVNFMRKGEVAEI